MRLKKTQETRSISEKKEKVAIKEQFIQKKRESISSRMSQRQYGDENFSPEQWLGYTERKKFNSLSRRKQERILEKMEERMQKHPTKEMLKYAELKEKEYISSVMKENEADSFPKAPVYQTRVPDTRNMQPGTTGEWQKEWQQRNWQEVLQQGVQKDAAQGEMPMFPYQRQQYKAAKLTVKRYEQAAAIKKASRIQHHLKSVKIQDAPSIRVMRLRRIPASMCRRIKYISRDNKGNRVSKAEYRKALKYITEYDKVQQTARQIYKKSAGALALGAAGKAAKMSGKATFKEWKILMKAKNHQNGDEQQRQASAQDIGRAYQKSYRISRRGAKVKKFIGSRKTTRRAVDAVASQLARIPILRPVMKFKMGDTAANINTLLHSPKRLVRLGGHILKLGKNAIGFAIQSAAGGLIGFLPIVFFGILLISVVSAFAGVEAEGSSGNGTQIVEVAQQELSLSSQNVGGQKYKNWYGMNADWCAMFVSWCGNECDYITQGIMPKTAAVSGYMSWYLDKGLFEYKEGYTPKAGDFIVFKSAGASHIGIVVENSDGSTVKTIEGNSGGSSTSPYHMGSHVAAHSYSLDFAQITGYCTPAYPESAGGSVGPNAAFDDAPDAPADYTSGKYQQVTARLTAYCTCEICCGKWSGGPTASGVYPKQGQTIALDREAAQDLGLNFGARIAIDGKEFIYQDSGGSPMNDAYHQTGYLPIDVFFQNHADAQAFGVKVVPVYILSKS